MNIYDIINRARSLREEYRLDSVTPERLGALHEDTLTYINQYQLLASSPAIQKTFVSVSAMQGSASPTSDLTGRPLKAGQLVVIVPSDQTDSTAGDVYRYDGPSGSTSKWTFVAKLGAVPADSELSATSTNPPQNRAVTEKLTELESEIDELIFDINAYRGDYTPFTDREKARAAAPYSKIGKKGLILKYLTTEGWVIEMQITDGYSSKDDGWATIYNGNDERMRNMATDMFGLVSMPLFQVMNDYTINDDYILKIYEDFNVFSSTRVSLYKTIPAQELTLPNDTYWSACLVFDINNKQFETSLKVFSLISSSTFTNPQKEDGKLYIPILWCLSNRNKIESRQDIRSFYPQAKPVYNTPTALVTSPYRGVYLPSGKINRVLVNVVDTTADLSFYKLNLKTKQIELIKTFASTSLRKGLQMLDFDTSVVVGGENQIVFSGKVGYRFIDAMDITVYSYYPETKKIEFSHNTTLLFGLVYGYTDMYDATSEYPKMMDLILQGETISNIPTPTDINNCTAALSNVGYVGQLVTGGIKVVSIDVNVRNVSENIHIITYNTITGKTEELKSVTPTSVGILNIPFNSPIKLGEIQILVHGGIGFKSMSQGYSNFVGANIEYNYSGSGVFTIGKVTTIAWGIRYNVAEPIALVDYIANFTLDYYLSFDTTSVRTEIINVEDFDNNLRKAFQSISPSVSKRFVIEMPEGIYDVKSWFTDDEIAKEESRFMGGLQVPNYVKLLGVGARDKIILKWDNSGNVHYGQISTLNMKDWNELENLTIVGNNVRYAVHDDYQASKAARHLRVVNCDFQITDGSRAWGAGHNGGYDGEFINCKFSLFRGTGYVQNYTYIEPFVLHDNIDSVGDSKVLFENCRFYNEYTNRPCLAFGMNANKNKDITRAVVNGCKMNTYLKMSGNDNICTGRVTGYANVMGSVPQIEGAEQDEDIVDILWSQL